MKSISGLRRFKVLRWSEAISSSLQLQFVANKLISILFSKHFELKRNKKLFNWTNGPHYNPSFMALILPNKIHSLQKGERLFFPGKSPNLSRWENSAILFSHCRLLINYSVLNFERKQKINLSTISGTSNIYQSYQIGKINKQIVVE